MSAKPGRGCAGATEWSVLGQHDWGGAKPLVVTLHDALRDIEVVDDTRVVFDYVDPDAVAAVFGSGEESRGAESLSFRCDRFEIRIDADGTIAAKSASSDR